MSDDWDDEDSWDDDYDDPESDEFEDEPTGPCPECGTEMHADAEACPACGHWLSTAQRHALWDGGEQPLKHAGKIALIVVLIVLLSGFLFL